jgi:hypothetical protein
VLSQAQRGQLAADLKTEASTRTIPADDWVLNEISAHVQRFGTGSGGVIVTDRLGRVARRNSFGDRWPLAVADARTCGKPPAPAFEGGRCGETRADPAHCLPKGTRFHDLHFYASTLKVSGVASAASAGGSGECGLPAVQRAAPEQAGSHESPGTLRGLGCHHPLASSRTMMQPVRLQRIPD